jgi:hypothetical protein
MVAVHNEGLRNTIICLVDTFFSCQSPFKSFFFKVDEKNWLGVNSIQLYLRGYLSNIYNLVQEVEVFMHIFKVIPSMLSKNNKQLRLFSGDPLRKVLVFRTRKISI